MQLVFPVLHEEDGLLPRQQIKRTVVRFAPTPVEIEERAGKDVTGTLALISPRSERREQWKALDGTLLAPLRLPGQAHGIRASALGDIVAFMEKGWADPDGAQIGEDMSQLTGRPDERYVRNRSPSPFRAGTSSSRLEASTSWITSNIVSIDGVLHTKDLQPAVEGRLAPGRRISTHFVTRQSRGSGTARKTLDTRLILSLAAAGWTQDLGIELTGDAEDALAPPSVDRIALARTALQALRPYATQFLRSPPGPFASAMERLQGGHAGYLDEEVLELRDAILVAYDESKRPIHPSGILVHEIEGLLPRLLASRDLEPVPTPGMSP